MSMPTLDEMQARAQRQLDGMTVNRDAMANDVLRLVDLVRRMQQRAALLDAAGRAAGNLGAGAGGSRPYEKAFADVFGDIFGRRPDGASGRQ